MNGLELHSAAEIADNPVIIHPVGIVVGGQSKIGRYVQINQGVSVGYRRGPIPGDGHPTVEDDVINSTGAKLLGPIIIGRGAVIGANAVVLDSVPPIASAVGVPAHILSAKEQVARTWIDG